MNWIAKDLPGLVLLLLPGFVAAGVYYTLTSHTKASEFERVIQALIFTTLLRPLAAITHWISVGLGHLIVLGPWTENSDIAASLLLAVPVGLAAAYLANKDVLHKFARSLGWIDRTSYPSEWYSAFVRERRWVVLHFADRRRLFGFPVEWPNQPEDGHFVIDAPAWLLEDNRRAPLYLVSKILVPASDIKMVEFLKAPEEIAEPPQEWDRVEAILVQSQKGESDGDEGPATDAAEQPTG